MSNERLRVLAMAFGMVAIASTSWACGGSAPAATATLGAVAATAPATASPAPTPTPAATPSPTAEPTPTLEPTPTPACSVVVTGTPTANEKVLFSGRGYDPGTYVTVTFNGPTLSNFTFDPNEKQGGVKLLKVKRDGTFGPWDVIFNTADVGDWTLGFSDGDCDAEVSLTIAQE